MVQKQEAYRRANEDTCKAADIILDAAATDSCTKDPPQEQKRRKLGK